ncbi:MAG: hypothetical protein A4E57_02651 [Syntrophorhabdaceae bacterium PtaU1.Bin034]|nr:MAG: hypothetical protein A4E57_02651 [Syntrophorhabdaceae bacterium PtaU1.Bin034]
MQRKFSYHHKSGQHANRGGDHDEDGEYRDFRFARKTGDGVSIFPGARAVPPNLAWERVNALDQESRPTGV